MKRIHLVSGASGHLGNTLCRELSIKGEAVRALVLPGDPAIALRGLDVDIVEADLTDIFTLEAFFSGLEKYDEVLLYHLAGMVSIRANQFPALWLVNVEGTSNILALAKKHKVTRFLYTSSVHAIPEVPHGEVHTEVSEFDATKVHGDYAKTKAEATRRVLQAGKEGLDVVVVHPSGIIGPYDFGSGHLTKLLISYIKGKIPMSVAGGYDFVDVRDVVDGVIKAMEKGRSGECYILSGHYSSIHDLFGDLAELSGKKKKRCIAPIWAAAFAGACSEFFNINRKKTPLFTRYSVYTLQSNSLFSHAKATLELGYNPRPLHETLRDTLAYLVQSKRLRRTALPPKFMML